MPIYEYECTACGAVTESLVRGEADEKALQCPTCGSRKLRKKFSAPAIIGESRTDAGTTCESDSPCCGRDVRCDHPPCD